MRFFLPAKQPGLLRSAILFGYIKFADDLKRLSSLKYLFCLSYIQGNH